MSPAAIALLVMAGIVGFASLLGLLARSGHRMDFEQWTVGGRGFGLLLVFLLMAGEIYTTFAVLGMSGWIYSRGGPALYILAYLPLGQVTMFYLSPIIWRLGRKHGLKTQADFFAFRYGGKFLPVLVATVGIVAIVPYLQLQLTGLGIIVDIASYGALGRTEASLIAATLITAFVLTSGIRGAAAISVVKDLLMVIMLVTLGIALPWLYFGGIGTMYTRLMQEHPTHLTMPGATTNLGHLWYVTTVLLCAAGFLWPHTFAAIFTGKSGGTLRRAAVMAPLYTLSLGFVFLAGCAALLAVPHASNGDLALLTAVRGRLPPWFLGVVGGAGALTALVPASVLVLAASTLFAKNIYRPLLAPRWTDEQVGRLARVVVVVLILLSLFFALSNTVSLVSLLLLGYGCVAQLAPGIMLGVFWRRISRAAVILGSVTGLTIMAGLGLTHRDPFHGCSAGFLALCVNLGVTIAATAFHSVDQVDQGAALGDRAQL